MPATKPSSANKFVPGATYRVTREQDFAQFYARYDGDGKFTNLRLNKVFYAIINKVSSPACECAIARDCNAFFSNSDRVRYGNTFD